MSVQNEVAGAGAGQQDTDVRTAARGALERVRADAALVADGLRGRREARREQETLAEYRVNGDPDAPVRDDLRNHYEKALEWRRRAELDRADGSITTADIVRYAPTAAVGAVEANWVLGLAGSLPPGPLMTAAGLTWLGNLVAVPLVWRRLKKAGQDYRAKIAAREAGEYTVEGAMPEAPTSNEAAEVITAALRAAGVLRAPTTNTPGQRVELCAPISDDGESWTARVVLPQGITTAKVRKRLMELASGFDRSLPQVAVLDGESERRMTLRVWHGNALPFTGEPTPSPLVNAAAFRLDQGIPVGLDADGAPVVLNLGKGRHGLVVASSGNGKTVLLQTIAAATVLDPKATLTILDGKPDGAYTTFKPACWEFETTAHPDYEERGAEVLEAVAEDMDERLARAEAGEELEGDHVVILDEFQEWTGNANGEGQRVGKPRYRMRVALERIARRGRAARVRLVLASQQYDGRTLDNGVLANIGWRAIGYCPSDMAKDALAEYAARYGLDTSTMFVDEVQAGASVIVGGGVHPYRAQRANLMTRQDMASVVERGLEMRGGEPARSPQLAAVPDHTETRCEQPELDGDEETVIVTAAALYATDDSEWITANDLYREVIDGELGWETNKSVQMLVARAMSACGVEKIVDKVERPSGKTTRVTSYRRADIVAAGAQLDRAA